jgi:thiol-disulfide isomerase/thioredoxin
MNGVKRLVEPTRAPALRVEGWLNLASTEGSLAHWAGHVILLDFWEATCSHCRRMLPVLIDWHTRYGPLGLVVVGIHSPEYAFGQDPQQVAETVRGLGLPYPVALDSQRHTWEVYGNRAWPTQYLIDAQGRVRAYHVGEGDIEALEACLIDLLAERDPVLAGLPRPEIPAEPPPSPATPEVIFGWLSRQLANAAGRRLGERSVYALPGATPPQTGQAVLVGPWIRQEECVVSAGSPQTPAELMVPYEGASVVAVLGASLDQGAVTVQVRLDGAPLPEAVWGRDITASGSGAAQVTVSGYRLVHLVEAPTSGVHRLSLVCETPGTAIYSLCFEAAPGPLSLQP